MISCSLELNTDVDDLYKILKSEELKSPRAHCTIKKNKRLILKIEAKDPVSMKAFLNTILKIIETYQKIKNETGNPGKNKPAPEP